jgi:hypothetical protein
MRGVSAGRRKSQKEEGLFRGERRQEDEMRRTEVWSWIGG